MQAELPEPDLASAAHSERVAAHIRELIAAQGGMISFAEFMHEALYAPGLGYYAAGATKFGAAGDFVTAPEVSPLFGRIVARQCAEAFAESGGYSILEFGAGSGRLAVDLLRTLGELGALPDHYRILEVSADLSQRQRERLERDVPDLADRVVWLDRLPDTHRGAVIANEVLDALPVERFRRSGSRILQGCVAVADGGFTLRERPAGTALTAAVEAIEGHLGRGLADGFVSEVCLALPDWIGQLARLLEDGLALIFDYGVSRREYYGAERDGGWLRCHFRHRAHGDPLLLPGIQDITSWVDFTAVADAAVADGLDVAGFVTQAQFLLHGGLDRELAGLAGLAPEVQLQLSAQVKRLTLPAEMGEHFKCLGLRRGRVSAPPALAAADRAAAL